MSRFHRGARRCAAVIVFFTALAASAGGAFAQATSILSGTVTASGRPLADAQVSASGGNLSVHAKTGAQGTFAFPALPIGTYAVRVTSAAGTGALSVDLTGSGANVTLDVTPIRQIGRTAVTSRPPARGSGTDISLNAQALARSPAAGNLPSLLLQLPGAARGANGVVHINGDHGDVNYVVDGVQVPQALNRTLGTEFDPSDIAFIEALQGAYPAQYGERFASVININSRTGAGPAGFTADIAGGSYALLDTTLGYHGSVGAGSLVVAARNQRSGRGLDPPGFSDPHNAASNANQFLRFTLPSGPNFFNLTVSRAYQTYQIPADVAGGAPAATDDNQTQEDLFTSLQWRHPVADHGSLAVGASVKRSRIRDLGDPANDIAYGAAQNPGAPTDCAQALLSAGPVVNGVVTAPVPNPAVNYSTKSCGLSLTSDRTASDVVGNLDYVNTGAKHAFALGALYDATTVRKRYAVTLQPGNFLAPLYAPSAPGAAYTVTDSAPNAGRLQAAYLQDSWKMGTRWQLDYGVRADAFQVSSDQFSSGFGQISPRLKLSRLFGPRESVYVYYGRFFTPFSLENVAPLSAYALNLPLQSSPAAFDLRPQRDSVYELGGHVALGRGDLGLRVMQKNAADLIDDAQVGVTDLHQDINYAQGRIATQTAYYQLPLARGGRLYASLTHTYAADKGCETQLLAPCFGSPADWTPADHDQRYDATAGLLLNDRRGGWFSVDGEYGSGLSAALNPTGGITCAGPGLRAALGGPCKRTAHLTFDALKGIALNPRTTLTLRVQNLLNDRYFVTYANAQGQHAASPRSVQLGLQFGGPAAGR